jgi:hypothetical protein
MVYLKYCIKRLQRISYWQFFGAFLLDRYKTLISTLLIILSGITIFNCSYVEIAHPQLSVYFVC